MNSLAVVEISLVVMSIIKWLLGRHPFLTRIVWRLTFGLPDCAACLSAPVDLPAFLVAGRGKSAGHEGDQHEPSGGQRCRQLVQMGDASKDFPCQAQVK